MDLEVARRASQRQSHRGFIRFDWSDFLRAQRNDKVLLLFQSDALFNFIPKRALTDAQADDIWRCFEAHQQV